LPQAVHPMGINVL